MDWNRKKMWPAAAATLVAITSLLNAADDSQVRTLENRVSSLEQRKGAGGMINPPARPVVKDPFGLTLKGDALFWQANETDLCYAVLNEGGTTYLNDGEMEKVGKTDWDWGFKLAAGYDMPHDGWDLFLQWTRFYTDEDKSTSANSGGMVFPTYFNADLSSSGTPSQLSGGFANANAYWNMHLNLLDLELGREFYVSKWLTLRPHGGLRTAWIRQYVRINYLKSNTDTFGNKGVGPSLPAGQNVHVSLKNDFWGIGLRGGLDGDWGVGYGISIFGELAAALLLGDFDVHVKEKRVTASPEEIRLNLDNDDQEVTRLTVDFAMGLRYQHRFADDRYGFMIQMGWEQHMFLGQNQLFKVHTAPAMFSQSNADLNTQGVTGSIKFDF